MLHVDERVLALGMTPSSCHTEDLSPRNAPPASRVAVTRPFPGSRDLTSNTCELIPLLYILGFGCGPDGSLQNEEIRESNKYLWAG